MPFSIERNDLARVDVDAIVVAANERLQITGGVGAAVADAAGFVQMKEACNAIGFCPQGSAVVTPGFALPARYVIHAVGPVWLGGGHDEVGLLRKAYDSALARADELAVTSVALPLLSAGAYGFPAEVSLDVARESIRAFLDERDVDVRLVLYDRASVAAGISSYDDLVEYIDDHYVDDRRSWYARSERRQGYARENAWFDQKTGKPIVPDEPPGTMREGAHASAQQWSPDGYRSAPSAPGAQPVPHRVPDVRPAASMPAALRPSGSGSFDDEDRRRPRPSIGGLVESLRARLSADKADDVVADMSEEEEFEWGDAPAPDTTEKFAPITDEPALTDIVEERVDYGWDDRTEARQEAGFSISYNAPAPAARWDAGALPATTAAESFAGSAATLEDLLDSLDEPFSTTLLALIDARGMSDAEVYKRANMSRQLFSKIRSDAGYRPTKKTALALAVALGLDLDETNDLLRRAGFALSNSSKADVIVEFFIASGNHDIFEINEALYAFDQPLL